MLNDVQRSTLLLVARNAVLCNLQEITPTLPDLADDSLMGRHAAFVSLHFGGELRGCIGEIEDCGPLIEAVARCAISAATADPRFPPVTIDEMNGIRIEISILSSPRAIAGAAEIEIGRHGVTVAGRGRKALLLPQVAEQCGWSADEFIEAVCRKAGLHPAGLRGGGLQLETFTAEVFAETP